MDTKSIIEKIGVMIKKLPFTKICENSSIPALKSLAPFANYIAAAVGCVLVLYVVTAPFHGSAPAKSKQKTEIAKSDNAKSKSTKPKKNSSSSKTILKSNDGTISCDLVGTWVNNSGNATTTMIFRSNGTFEYNVSVSYRGPEQITIGPNGSITNEKGWKTSGNWFLIDGNILHREYTSVWSNIDDAPAKGSTSNRELRPLSDSEFLLNGNATFKRKN